MRVQVPWFRKLRRNETCVLDLQWALMGPIAKGRLQCFLREPGLRLLFWVWVMCGVRAAGRLWKSQDPWGQ